MALPSMPTTSRACVASGKVKFPKPQNKVGDPLAGMRVEQAQGTRHQYAVDMMIDLREIGRLERHRDTEFRQQVLQLGVGRIILIRRIEATLVLQPPLHLILIGKRFFSLTSSSATNSAMMRNTMAVIMPSAALRRPPTRSAASCR